MSQLTSSRFSAHPRFRSRCRRVLVASSAALSAAAWLQSCAEPRPDCITSTATYAFKLVEQDRQESTPGACDPFGPSGFNQDPEVSVIPYYALGPSGPDYGQGSIGVQTAELGSLNDNAFAAGIANQATDGAVYSLGAFSSSKPDGLDLCYVPELSRTHLVLPELPSTPDDPSTPDLDESAPGQPAVDITLDWSNVKVYVTADLFGTQVSADLTDTRRGANGATCTIHYLALGMAPGVACRALDPDSGAELTNADGSYQLDPGACDPEPDPDNGRPTGSGISPSAAFECDAASGYCVLSGEAIPSRR